ncbi:MotE family protein [Sporomusa aerivorans]|uniref:MotE family protein n=1 Tax=Sporomusa aerivorans TaxID=204936 RepID=UPI00352B7A3A
MAEKPKNPPVNSKQPANTVQQPPEAAKSKFGLFFKIMIVALSLCILVAIGFAAGVYLKFIDVDKLAGDLNLSQYPVVGRFFPKTNFEPVELEEDQAPQPVLPVPSAQNQQPIASLPAQQPVSPNTITKEELEKQAKIKQQEEAKRISKLARLYTGMKPEAAVAIMHELDDPTVIAIFGKMEEEQVSKILSLLDSKRAARLSEDMLKGRVQQPVL